MSRKIVICGYSSIAASVVRILLDIFKYDHSEILCVTYDLPGNSLFLEFLQKRGVPHIIGSIRSTLIQQRISDFQPDYLGSIYFRDIIPKKVLEVVKLRNFNAHPSLLPDYKGCFSSCWCLINGESKTGVTYHEMNEKIDEGDILWQVETPIYKTDTGFSLFQRLVSDVIINFRPFYKALLDGELSVRPMPKGGRYFKREAPYQGKINPEWPDQKIERFIRAMFFPPFEGATVEIKGQSYEVNSMKEYLDLRNRFDI